MLCQIIPDNRFHQFIFKTCYGLDRGQNNSRPIQWQLFVNQAKNPELDKIKIYPSPRQCPHQLKSCDLPFASAADTPKLILIFFKEKGDGSFVPPPLQA